MTREEITNVALEKLVIKTFKEYGGWWKIEGMAEWLDVSISRMKTSWDSLTGVGLMERK